MFELNNGEPVGTPKSDDKYFLSKLLIDITKSLGHRPSFDEISRCPRMPKDPNLYAVHFGSLDRAHEEAEHYVNIVEGHDRVTKISETSARKREIESVKFQMSHIRERAKESQENWRRCKMEKREENSALVQAPETSRAPRKQTRKRRIKTDEELWAELREKIKSLGRFPTLREITDDPELSTPQTYYARLGGDWREKIEAELPELLGAIDTTKAPTEATDTTEAPTEIPEPTEAIDTTKAPEPTEAIDTRERPDAKEAEEVTEMEESTETVVLPIKVILPKGMKGSIKIELDF